MTPGAMPPETLPSETVPSQHILTMERVLAATPAQVFHAWTDATAFAQWFGPHGAALPVAELDARPGGAMRFCHRFPDAADVWVQGRYDEVVPPSRLVFTLGFVDEAGRPAPHPGFPGWPIDAAIVTTVTLAAVAEGTRLTVEQRVTPVTADVRQERELARQGWIETLERLVQYLATSNQEQA
jgi:uncharacterized protein YndB with AHSA1/START domain